MKKKTKKPVNRQVKKQVYKPADMPTIPSGFKRAVGSGGKFFVFDQVGKSLSGKFKEVVKTKKKNTSDMLILTDDKNDIVKTSYTSGLKDIFEHNKIKKGAIVVISLIGVTKLQGGRTFKQFDVLYK